MPGETLFICASMLFFIGCNLRRALFKVLMLLPIRNQDFIISHKWHVHPHVKNKSLWDSSSCLQNTQVGLIWINLNLSRVRNLPKTTNHNMKLYLGRDHYSQTTLCHEMIEPTGWKKLYAWARKGLTADGGSMEPLSRWKEKSLPWSQILKGWIACEHY
jgi:hypothetical protein